MIKQGLESLNFTGKRYGSKSFLMEEFVTLFEQVQLYVWNNFLQTSNTYLSSENDC